MAATSDALQNKIVVGDIVYVPITVTAIGGTPAKPTVTGNTLYVGFDGNADVVGPVDANQVVESK